MVSRSEVAEIRALVRECRDVARCACIRVVRERAGITQERLASMVGVTRRTVVRWENGRAWPTGTHRIKLAAVLDVPLSLLN